MNYTITLNNINKRFYWPIVIIVAIQKYIPPELFLVINGAFLLYLLFSVGKIELNTIWGAWALYSIFILGVIVGAVSLSHTNVREYIRDIFYYINPIIFILCGTFYAKLNISYTKYCNSLVLGAMFPIIIYYYKFLNGVETTGVSGYVWIQIVVLLINKFDKKIVINKFVRYLILILMLCSLVIGFSRTSILIVLCVYIFGSIKDSDLIKILKTVLTITIGFIIGYIVFYNVLPEDKITLYSEKVEKSFEEINPNLNWNDPMVITGHWRGYESHCAIEEFKEGNPLEQIVGYGFGKRIRVGKYSYLLLLQKTPDGKPAEDIAITHNGYANLLVKLGLSGIVLIFTFYIILIVKSLKYNKEHNSLEARLLAGIMVALAVETVFLNGLFKESCYYGLVTSIGYFGYRIKNNKTFEEK